MSRKTQAAPRTAAAGEAGQMDAVSRHREKVLAHAEAQLALQGKESPAELLALYKRFLKIENHRLRLKHYAGGGGREIAHQRASLVDIVLRHLFDGAAAKAGRGEPEGTVAGGDRRLRAGRAEPVQRRGHHVPALRRRPRRCRRG